MVLTLMEWLDSDLVIKVDGEQVDPVIHAASEERVVLDLHPGRIYFSPGSDPGTEIPDGDPFRIRPNEAVRIKTREVLYVPGNLFGEVCSRASLTTRGLLASHLKIDPHFQGPLFVTLYNVGPQTITLSPDQAFCSIFFHKLSQPTLGPARVPPVPPSRSVTGIRALYWNNQARILTALISLGVSVTGSIIATTIIR